MVQARDRLLSVCCFPDRCSVSVNTLDGNDDVDLRDDLGPH